MFFSRIPVIFFFAFALKSGKSGKPKIAKKIWKFENICKGFIIELAITDHIFDLMNENQAEMLGVEWGGYSSIQGQKQSSRGVSVKKVFLEISQNSQENTCARAFW